MKKKLGKKLRLNKEVLRKSVGGVEHRRTALCNDTDGESCFTGCSFCNCTESCDPECTGVSRLCFTGEATCVCQTEGCGGETDTCGGVCW